MDHPYDAYEQRGPQASGAFSDRRGREIELAPGQIGEGQETLQGAGSISGARPAQGAAQPSDPIVRDHRSGLCPQASEAESWPNVQEQISSTMPGGPLQEEFEDELNSEFDPDDEGVPF